MYVNTDRGFGVVAFHFDPSEYEELEKEHEGTKAELCGKLLARATPVCGELLPNGVVAGAVNIVNICQAIGTTVAESLLRRITELETQNDQGNPAADHQEPRRITENLSNNLTVESPKM